MGCVGGRRGGASGTSSVLMASVAGAATASDLGPLGLTVAWEGAVAVAVAGDVGEDRDGVGRSVTGAAGSAWRTSLTRPPVQSSRRRT